MITPADGPEPSATAHNVRSSTVLHTYTTLCCQIIVPIITLFRGSGVQSIAVVAIGVSLCLSARSRILETASSNAVCILSVEVARSSSDDDA